MLPLTFAEVVLTSVAMISVEVKCCHDECCDESDDAFTLSVANLP